VRSERQNHRRQTERCFDVAPGPLLVRKDREDVLANVPRAVNLAKIASWYYERGEGLSAIAKRTGKSISMISRMLQEARDTGLVEIRIKHPLTSASELERQVEDRFQLKRAHVFKAATLTGVDRVQTFGAMAAASISELLAEAAIVGVSWGSHVHATTNAVSVTGSKGGLVVQCSGAVGAAEPAYDGARIAEKLALALGHKARLLHSPLIVDTPELADALRSSKSIFDVIELSKRADVLLLGVGTPFDEFSGLRRTGYLSTEDLIELRENDAAGDILGYHLNKDGRVLDIDLNRRIVGLHPESIGRVPNVIVTTSGATKVAPIQAALRGGYVTTLITDESTAQKVLS
jgi:deoxyribonucleoside regulator